MRAAVFTAVCAAFCVIEGCGGNAVMDSTTGGTGGAGGAGVAGQGGDGGSTSSVGGQGCEVQACNPADYPTILIAKDQYEPDGIVVDQDAVYWAVAGFELDPPSRAIMRADLSSGAIVKIAEDQKFPHDLAMDAQFLYWTTQGHTIGRAPKTGGQVETLYKDLWGAADIAVDENYLYIAWFSFASILRVDTKMPDAITKMPTGEHPDRVITDDTHLYWMELTRLMRASKADLVPMLLYEAESSNGQPTVGQAVVDEERVYFTIWPEVQCEGDQMIVSMPKDGGELVTVVGKEHRIGGGPMVADGAFLYWAEYGRGRIMKAPKTGGAPILLACGQDKPRGLAVDANFVYWTTEGGGTVMKAPK